MNFANIPVQNIPFGVSLPPYQSRSTGIDFENILQHLKQDLKAAGLRHTMEILTPSDYIHGKQYPTANTLGFSLTSQLFGKDSSEFSLVGDLLMMALEESRLASKQAAWEAETGEKSIESQIDERYKFNLSKVGELLRKLA